MDGRIIRKLSLGAVSLGLAAGLGCKTTNNAGHNADPTPYQPPVAEQPSTMSKFFGGASSKSFTPQAPTEQPVVRDHSKRGKGLGAEGEIGLATARFDAAAIKQTTVERDQMLDAARQGFLRALKVDPKSREAHVGLARLYSSIGDKTNAVAMLKAATEFYPNDHELHHRLAAVYFQFQEPALAAQSTKNALQHDPNNRTYLKTLALCQGQMDDWQSAFATLVGRNVMTEPEARYFLGRALVDMGRMDEGKAQIETAANMDPNFAQPKQFLTDLANGGPKSLEPVMTVGYEATDPPLIR